MSSEETGPAGGAGKDMLWEAMKLTLEKESGIPAIPLLQKALALGLAPGDEVEARLSLGEGYREIFGNSDLPWQKMVETNEFHQCMAEIEKAFELDRAGSLDFFAQPLNIGRLKHLDIMYMMAAEAEKEQVGTDAAIGYLAAKLRAVEYLARPPLLRSLLKLAELYRETGAVEEATRYLRKVVNTEPLYPADQELNEQLRGEAQKLLSDVQGQPKNLPGAPATRSGCFIATAVYGSEDVNELIILRHFRDRFLAERASGRAFIRAYNVLGPVLASFIRRSGAVRAVVRRLLVKPAAEFAKWFLPKSPD